MESDYLSPDEFKAALIRGGAQARIETLAAGVPVFYRDEHYGVEIVEYPDGRKYEISYIDGAPADQNYKVLRQLSKAIA